MVRIYQFSWNWGGNSQATFLSSMQSCADLLGYVKCYGHKGESVLFLAH